MARHDFAARSDGASLEGRIALRAAELGFDAMAIADATQPLDEDFARYEAFVAAQMHGAMGYLADHGDVRRCLNDERILPGARSVLCLARRYRRPNETDDPALAQHVARYARGRDYHNFLRKKLRQLAAFVEELGTAEAPVRARALCDTAPVLERAWAARSGLGFVGKNGMLIVPGQGSMVLLGEVVTTLALVPGTPMNERCGSCTRCLDACPTNAFVGPWVLDARQCLAYTTIEWRGPVDPSLREATGEHLFGCDDCQTVCPFNAGARAWVAQDKQAEPFTPLGKWAALDLVGLLELDPVAFRDVFEGSPMGRPGWEGLLRNAALVLGNRGDPDALPVLERVAQEHPSAVVRDAAQWAIARLKDGSGVGSPLGLDGGVGGR